MAFTENQAYTSETGLNSIAANFYGRMKYWQDFGTDGDSYDLTRWDEASNNSQYWNFAGNVGTDYRNFYDYAFIRELNLHIRNLNTVSAGSIAVDKLKYFQAEARYFRAYTYFKMVVQYGGVPLVTEVTEYMEDPTPLAVPRNKESEIYDFIISEMDAIKEDFGTARVKTRATKGAAMALKCRAALYAGTLAYNYDKSATKTLNLSSGATGIERSKAEGYLKACLDACAELEAMGYQLYQKQADQAGSFSCSISFAAAAMPSASRCRQCCSSRTEACLITPLPRSSSRAPRSEMPFAAASARRSVPRLPERQASSAIINRPVFRSDSRTVSGASGSSRLSLMTSARMPSAESVSAAASAALTLMP